MIQITHTRLLVLSGLVFLLGILASCHKEDKEGSGKVELLNYGPTGARHGDTLRFFGNNLNKVTAIQFTGPGAVVEQKDFKQQSANLILLTVPQSAEKGYVTLKTPQGDIVTKTQLNLDVLISVASITNSARPGENITITGDYLNWVDRILFNKDKIVQTFVSQSKNQLVVTVPDDAQTGTLLLHYSGTDSADLETLDTLHVTLPVAQSFSPSPVKHNTNLTIQGTDLDLVRKVQLPGVSDPITSFASQSPTELVLNIDSATTKGKVVLFSASGVSTTSAVDLEVALPVITGMNPNPVNPGSNLTLSGTNLDLVTKIGFIGANPVTSFVSQSPTQIVVQVPASAITGKVTFSVLKSILTVKSDNDLAVAGSSVPPIIIYDDAVTSAWNGWVGGGWGGTKDVNNTTNVKSGSKSVRINYNSGEWGVPLQLGGATIPLSGYTSLKVSIYGGTGSNGKNINIGFNELDGKTVTLVEGQWNEFTIPLSQISSTSTLTHLYIKNYTESGSYTIYVDDLGIY